MECTNAKNKYISLAYKGFFVALSLVTMLIINIIGKISYSIIDDYGMSDIAGKYYNTKTGEYLIWNNIILGKMVKGLYKINNQINWYGVLMAIILIICFAILMNIFVNKSNKLYSVVPVILVECVVFLNLTFTIASFIITSTAILFFAFINNEKTSNSKIQLIIKYVVFTILIVMGYMYRAESFIVTVLLMIPVWIYVFVDKKNRNKRTYTVLLVSIALLLLVGVYNNYKYSAKEWGEYSKSLKARSLIDYNRIDYEGHKDEIEKIGYTQNDIDCFYGWMFNDKKVFSDKKLIELNNINPLSEKYNFNIINIIKQLASKKTVWMLLLITIISIFLLSKRGKRYIIIVSMETLLLFIALVVRQKCVERVFIPILLVSLLCIYFFLVERINRKKVLYGLLVITVLLCSYTAIQGYSRYKDLANATDYSEVKAYIEKRDKDLFLADFTESYYIKGFYRSIFQKVSKDENIYSVGEWDTYSPRFYKKMRHFKISNPDRLMISLAENSNIYFVEMDIFDNGKNFEYLKKYIEEHTKKKVKDQSIKTFPKTRTIIHKLSLVKSE